MKRLLSICNIAMEPLKTLLEYWKVKMNNINIDIFSLQINKIKKNMVKRFMQIDKSYVLKLVSFYTSSVIRQKGKSQNLPYY